MGVISELPKRVLVIAGTYEEYKDFLRENHLSPVQFPYISRREQLMGQRGALYMLVGRVWLNEVYDKHMELFQVYDMKEVKQTKQEVEG